jgi:hypothetical protein
MQRPGPPGWGLDATLMILFCEKINTAKSIEVKSGSNSAESVLLMMIMIIMINI